VVGLIDLKNKGEPDLDQINEEVEEEIKIQIDDRSDSSCEELPLHLLNDDSYEFDD